MCVCVCVGGGGWGWGGGGGTSYIIGEGVPCASPQMSP